MRIRDYGHISQRLAALRGSHIRVDAVGRVETYPFYLVELGTSKVELPAILLTASVHGNEPSGVEAVLRFLERDHGSLLSHFRFLILPCINPTGYIRDLRENSRRIDINRAFEEDNLPEVQIVKEVLSNRQFVCALDFHEDWEAVGFYLYEGRREGLLLGEAIIERIKAIGPIEPDDPGDEGGDGSDPPRSVGIYPVASSWGTQGLTSYTHKYHSEHVLISEAPTEWEMERRVAAHLATLDLVLAHHLAERERDLGFTASTLSG